MIDTNNVVLMQLFLLSLVAVGFVVVKVRIINEVSRSSFSDLILTVFLPCNILSSFMGTSRSELPSLGIILVISIGILVISYVLSQFVLFRKAGVEQKKVLVFAILISNANFLGVPVIESIYGLGALSYVGVYLMPLRVITWAGGLAIFTGSKGSIKKTIFHPCMVATYLGLLIMIFGITPPAIVTRLVNSLGSCTTPLSMMVVGAFLTMVDPRKLITRLVAYFTFIRLALIPMIVMGFMFFFRPDPLISGISVVLSGMPAGVTTVILADKYGGDKELASKIVFISTLLSIISAPLLSWLIQQVLR